MITPERERYLQHKLVEDRKEIIASHVKLMDYYTNLAPGPVRDRVSKQIKELSLTIFHLDKYLLEMQSANRTFYGLLPDD